MRTDAKGRRVLYVKGSPEVLLAVSDTMANTQGMVPLDEQLVHAANERMGRDGLRAIATASRNMADNEELPHPLARPQGLTLLGLEGMTDPPRPGVAEAIADCRRAGIQVQRRSSSDPPRQTPHRPSAAIPR